MTIYLGNDICEIERIQKIYEKYGKKFLEKTYTEAEIKYCLSTPKLIAEKLAVRFSTKEAVSKALGVGINKLGWNGGINWKDVELVRDKKGAVSIKLSGKALEYEKKLGINKWTVSVSHSKTDAISTVIGYSE